MKKKKQFKASHLIPMRENDPAWIPFNMRLCEVLDKLKSQIDELVEQSDKLDR